MLGINRCYGCGGIIWPWECRNETKKVGFIHMRRGCILDAWYKLLEERTKHHYPDLLLIEASNALIWDKWNEDK